MKNFILLFFIITANLALSQQDDYNYRNAPAYGFNLMGTPWTLTYEIYFYTMDNEGVNDDHSR